MIIDKSRLPIAKLLTIGLLPSPLKVLWYKLRGAKIGRGVKIGLGAVISAHQSIEIGAFTTIGMFTVIDCKKLEIGKRTKIRSFVLIDAQEVIIGDDVIISETALIRTLVPSIKSKIILHDRVHIFPFSMIDPSRKVEIGEESSVGYDTYIFTHSAYKSKLEGYPVEFGEVKIGNRVWLPCRVFITQSVTIGDEAVIGTGALVNHDIPPGVLAVGTPAKVIKSQEEYVVSYSEAEKFKMLIEILNEFCHYLEEFGSVSWKYFENSECPRWMLLIKGKSQESIIELSHTYSRVTSADANIILGEVPQELQGRWNLDKKVWFSIDSHQCSEYLDSLGEELREYFRRYGIYFGRP